MQVNTNEIISRVADRFPCCKTEVSFKIEPTLDLQLYLSEISIVVTKSDKTHKIVGYMHEIAAYRFSDLNGAWLFKVKHMIHNLERKVMGE